MKKILFMGFIGALVAGLSFSTFAQNQATKEVSTAHAHALMSQGATTVSTAHMHLHHVINCLVGPKGSGFNAAAGNPCKGMGNGALNDSTSNAALQTKVKSALADANSGLESDSLSTVHESAAKVAAALGDTATQKPKGGYSW